VVSSVHADLIHRLDVEDPVFNPRPAAEDEMLKKLYEN